MSADERIALLYPYNLVQFSFEMKWEKNILIGLNRMVNIINIKLPLSIPASAGHSRLPRRERPNLAE